MTTSATETSDRLITVPQAAEILNISRSGVYRLMDHGALKSLRVGHARRIRHRDLMMFVDEAYITDSN